MAQMFFGQFLVNEELISEDALQQAIELASEENARLGELGIEHGYLTPAQVEQIHLEQRRVDLRFADLAVQLQMLTREQADILLRQQKRQHKPIGEALVQLGHLDRTELDDLLDRYHLFQLDLDAAHLELPVDLCDNDLALYLAEYFPKLFRRVTQVPLKLQCGRPWHGRSNLRYRVSTTIEGDCPLDIGIAACPDLAAQIAAGLEPGAPVAHGHEETAERVREFAEIFTDAGCRSVRQDGLHASSQPAQVDQLPKQGFWFPATTPFGRGILVLSAK